MITKEQAQALGYRQELFWAAYRFQIAANGTETGPQVIKVRVNGTCRVWKTRPEDFRLPLKYGLSSFAELTQRNAGEYFLTEAEANVQGASSHVYP